MLSITPAKLIRSELFKKTKVRIILLIFLTAVIAVGCTFAYPFFARWVFEIDRNSVDTSFRICVLRCIILGIIAIVPVSWICFKFRTVNLFLHKYRYAIGGAIIIIAVILNISGSSLGMWNFWLGHDMYSDVVFGTPRPLRTDEYVVNTPFAFAQAYSGYQYSNSLLGGTPSDMFIIKDTPVRTLAEIFRPFHWGYLVLGSSRGLAFYWSARTVVLFLASYELFRMLLWQKDNKENLGLSAIGAALVTFAPVIQWWYAVNGLVEMIIAIEVSIVCFDRYCRDHIALHRVGYSLVIALCAGMYILTLYPAWQIPLGYVLLVLFVTVLHRHWGTIHVSRCDVGAAAIITAGVTVLLGTVFFQSYGTIMAMVHTAYPGVRSNVGGDLSFTELFSGIASIELPFKDFIGDSNSTEVSNFVSLFPIGIILALINMIGSRKLNVFSCLLIVVTIIFSVFAVIGLPEFICSITLLNQTTGGRIAIVIGFISLLLLMHEAQIFKDGLCVSKSPRFITILCMGLACGAIAFSTHIEYPEYIGKFSVILLFIIACAVVGAVLAQNTVIHCALSVMVICGIACSGVTVNPVQYADAPLTEQLLTQYVKEIDEQNPGLWLVDGDDSARLPSLLVANGVAALNVVSVTPRLDIWGKIDENGKYQKIYNRYAFTSSRIQSAKGQPEFVLIAADAFEINLTAERLHRLDVDYVLSTQQLESMGSGGWSFEPLGDRIDGRRAYRLVRDET